MQVWACMAVSLTRQNKQTLKQLLKTGRWNNESEVLRYGLYLVTEEVRAKQREQLRPIPEGELARMYERAETKQDRAIERKLGKASMKALRQSLRNGASLDDL